MTDQDLADATRLAELLAQSPPLHVEIGPGHAAMLIATIQLAARHPAARASRSIKTSCEIARALQDALAAANPEIGRLLERGWHEAFDIHPDATSR